MKVLLENKKARFEYAVQQTWEAGIVLNGLEVKALRNKRTITIAEAWVKATADEQLYLVGAHFEIIAPVWQAAEPKRDRKLLLHKREIRKIIAEMRTGLSLIPLKFYFNDSGIFKVQIALAKGKKLHDKRQKIRERDLQRYGV